jgi:photosystem II stability/assembly factor-like uncharacterized protein
MAPKTKRILITIIVFFILIPGIQASSNDQAPLDTVFLPVVSYNLTGWIGPYGGTIIAIAYDPVDPQIVYAGSYGSGVFKSTDGGRNWFSVNHGLTNRYVYSLAINPQDTSMIYAGTYRGQVYKTNDGGNSWEWSGNGMQADAIVYSIAIDPFAPDILYAATRGDSTNGHNPWNGVVYRSLDGGLSWMPSLFDVGGTNIQDWAYSVIVNPNKHDQVFAASHENGPYRSNNSGDTWNNIDNGIDDRSGRALVISPQPQYSTILYHGVWHFASVYKTTNSGDLWKGASRSIPNVMVYNMAIDPFSVDTVYVASFSDGILKTIDGADYWLYAGLFTNKIYSIAVNPSLTNNLLTGTAGDGIYRSADSSNSWQHSNTGIDNALVTSLVHSLPDAKKLYASVYGGGVYQSENRGQTWQELNTGLSDKWVHYLILDPANSERLYALTDTGGLFRNDLNNNSGWVKTGAGLPLTIQPMPAFPADHPFATLEMQEYDTTPQVAISTTQETTGLLTMIYAPSNPQVAYIGTNGHGVQRSSDGGSTWLPAGLGGNVIYSLAVDPSDSNLLYAATGYPGSMKMSSNGGVSWLNAELSLYFYTLLASPSETGVVYAGTNAGVYLYQSGVWTALGLSDQSVTALAFDPHRAGVIYAGTTSGAYYSPDGGNSWYFASDQLSDQTIQMISFDQSIPNVVYFSTKTHGIFLLAVGF